MLRVVELFAGIGSQTQALKNLGIAHDVVAISEIDKHAIKSYEAIHGPVNNLGDVKQIERLPECELLTYSFPCQDISVAGLHAGMSKDSGTRSGLLWEVERLLLKGPRPKYLLMENVRALVGKKHIDDFNMFVRFLNSLGYVSNYAVLDGVDYGMPQSRGRVFLVSKLSFSDFEFPEKRPLTTRLCDHLEEIVDEKYFINDMRSAKLLEKLKGKEISRTIRVGGRDSPSDKHNWDWVAVPYYINHVGNIELGNNDRMNRVHGDDGVCPTICTRSGGNTEVKVLVQDKSKLPEIVWRVRKLTPKECWRLMGFTDEQYCKAKNAGVSETQLYKQAGNSIIVNVLEAIFNNLFETEDLYGQD